MFITLAGLGERLLLEQLGLHVTTSFAPSIIAVLAGDDKGGDHSFVDIIGYAIYTTPLGEGRGVLSAWFLRVSFNFHWRR